MGSYLAKADGPTGESWRPRAGKNPRGQLRERLSRPNYAVCTPKRRLSFTGEPLGTNSGFTIAPQSHYPLQQSGASSVGVLPPVQWDAFKKKNVLCPRKPSALLSPVTIKIARPDCSTLSLTHQSCAGLSTDPCSRDSVLRVLRESHKRGVEDEERGFMLEQKSKRRRNDSGGSSHSAFEPLLPNGTPSQLVPRPGSLKRGMSSLAEESVIKRSRTSSISSGNGVHAMRGTPGNMRNPIHSSYSSSQGVKQPRKVSACSSPLSSPGSSRSQSPEAASKRLREDDGTSPSSASSIRSDPAAADKAPVATKATPAPRIPIKTSSYCSSNSGKRKRRIQLVSSHRDDDICLPPPPELGYTVTVKDLDEEKKAVLSKIQKCLQEPEKVASPPAATLIQPPATVNSSISTLSSILASTSPTPKCSTNLVISLDPSPTNTVNTQPIVPSSQLEVQKLITSASPVPISSTVTVLSSTTQLQCSGTLPKPSATADALHQPCAAPTTSASVDHPSAFSQVLAQPSKISIITPTSAAVNLSGLTSQPSIPIVSSAKSTDSTADCGPSSGSTSNPLLPSGFKPIFAPSTMTPTSATATSAPVPQIVQSFKPIFGSTAAATGFEQSQLSTATAPAHGKSPIFNQLSSNTTVTTSVFSSSCNVPAGTVQTPSTAEEKGAQTAGKSLFGDWTTSSTASTADSLTLVQPTATGSAFQFSDDSTSTSSSTAPPAASTTSSDNTFAHGDTQSNPASTTQKLYTFCQNTATSQNSTTSFGTFTMATTTPATAATTTTQSTFTFGKPSDEAPAAQSAFSSASLPKPFSFDGSNSSSTSTLTSAPFTFGASASTHASSFGTPSKPSFGTSLSGFAFGNTTTASVAPSFGTVQTQSNPTPSLTFGSTAPPQAPSGLSQQASTGFNFGTPVSTTPFGTPLSNNPAPQVVSFNFGAAASGPSTPVFGQSSVATGPIPFGSPGTAVQNYSAPPFGSPATPSFSIGAGSKPSGARQRLQARRQHNRKK